MWYRSVYARIWCQDQPLLAFSSSRAVNLLLVPHVGVVLGHCTNSKRVVVWSGARCPTVGVVLGPGARCTNSRSECRCSPKFVKIVPDELK